MKADEPMLRKKMGSRFGLAAGVWVLAVVFALSCGVVSGASWELIADVRLPRVLLASFLGMGLAVSGAVLQALFSNPLCEPYILGISSGSALGAVIGATVGSRWALFHIFEGIAGPAFLGGLGTALILYAVALRPTTRNSTLLLTGVMLGFLGSSLMTAWLALSDSDGIQRSLAWIFGELSWSNLNTAVGTSVGILFLSLMVWKQWRVLDAFLIGEEGAAGLGVDVQLERRRLIVVVSMLVSLCVNAGGIIGFVGLVVPHLARRSVGSLHRLLIPMSAILGAAMLTFSDGISRVVAQPYELPIGVVTALIGAPFFIGILLRNRRSV
jgi:iron complex transport system permease protein